MQPFEVRREQFVISTDKRRLNLQIIFDFLANRSYWARGRPLEIISRSIENSLCFGVYDGQAQVGFARVVTDCATFGWVCDLFILETHRKKALGKWLVQSILAHPDLKNIRRLLLATTDAGELYRKYGGFETLPEPERWMTRLQKPPG
ncbi:MAG TPA: GNAT family N-acetyltransferase [Verrucomicrobiae bacterium]|nr:GNAT family N-acetyltransferase [Verrucomicrobiae bacterium]